VPRDVSKLFCAQIKVPGGLSSEQEGDEACELVNGVDLLIGEGEDTIHAYLLKAVKNNNGSGVLLLSDIFGFEDSSTRDFAYRVACNGYKCVLY
jgi:carboxymethylenebutenolidase